MGHHLKMIHGKNFARNNDYDQNFFQFDANSSLKKTQIWYITRRIMGQYKHDCRNHSHPHILTLIRLGRDYTCFINLDNI